MSHGMRVSFTVNDRTLRENTTVYLFILDTSRYIKLLAAIETLNPERKKYYTFSVCKRAGG